MWEASEWEKIEERAELVDHRGGWPRVAGPNDNRAWQPCCEEDLDFIPSAGRSQ